MHEPDLISKKNVISLRSKTGHSDDPTATQSPVIIDSISQTLEKVELFYSLENHSASSALARTFKVSYNQRDDQNLLTPTLGGRKMEVKKAGKLWLEYYKFNSQKKHA